MSSPITLNFTPVIPPNSLILITGVNGYIGAQVADQAVQAGYRVRGTVRSVSRAQWVQSHFDKTYGSGKLELFQVEDIEAKGAFDEALKDVAGAIHVATNTSLTGKPEPYISNVISGTLSLLTSATQHPSVKRVVITSSSMAAVTWVLNKEYTWSPATSYNESAIASAYTEPFTDDKAFTVYAAAKAKMEKAVFEWVDKENPKFAVVTVLPAANFGSHLKGQNVWESTGGWPKVVFDGGAEGLKGVQPQFFIDVVDDAKLHIGALIHPDVATKERVIAFAHPYSWNTVLAELKKIYPQRKFAEELEGLGADLSSPPNEKALFLLNELGQKEFKTVAQSLKEAFKGVEA